MMTHFIYLYLALLVTLLRKLQYMHAHNVRCYKQSMDDFCYYLLGFRFFKVYDFISSILVILRALLVKIKNCIN